MKKLIITAIFVAAGFGAAFGQTAADLEKEFGKMENVYTAPGLPLVEDNSLGKAYAASPDVWMIPRFAVDGQVCKVRLFSRSRDYRDQELPFAKFAAVVDRLSPFESRGAAKDTNYGATATGGGAYWTTFNYEKVNLYFSGVMGWIDPDGLPLKRGEYTFSDKYPNAPEADAKPAPKPTPEEVYKTFTGWNYRNASIIWTGRKCVGE
jgi:hypothetical protein